MSQETLLILALQVYVADDVLKRICKETHLTGAMVAYVRILQDLYLVVQCRFP